MSDASSTSEKTESPAFESQLSEGRQRFLSHAIEHAFAVGRRSPEDFVRHFPPSVMMQGLADKPDVRASILVHATGIREKIAIRKSWASAAEDLEIALREGETNAASIMSVFAPDERVRYLGAKAIWSFLTEGEFWTADPGKKNHGPAKDHIAFLIGRALKDGLLTHRDVISGISVSELAARLPKAELGKLLEMALTAGAKKAPFTEVELLAAVPLPVLVDYVPLRHLWEAVVVPKIAAVHGYSDSAGPAADKAAAKDEPKKDGKDSSGHPVKPASQEDQDAEQVDWVDAADEANLISDNEEELSDDDFSPPGS